MIKVEVNQCLGNNMRRKRNNRNKIEIFLIILNHLAENSPERKTNLAHIARLNYRDLQKYLKILEKQEMVKIGADGEDEWIAISEKGRSIRTTMMIVLEELGYVIRMNNFQ